ncbi:MAG: DUF1566 domain-containing protein [Gammaproteobacteria bacterium]
MSIEPAPVRFELINDDQVRDIATVTPCGSNLIWTRANVSDKRLTWAQADEACKACRIGGHEDWRLPTRAELLTLVDDTRFDPAIDPIFHCKPNWYWASTPYAPSPGVCAWFVSFLSGGAFYGFRSNDGFVRAVRGGQ